MTRRAKISDETIEDVQSCFTSEKNQSRCVDKKLEEHGLAPEDKERVLMAVAKKSLE